MARGAVVLCLVGACREQPRYAFFDSDGVSVRYILPQTEELVSYMTGIDLRIVPGDHLTAPATLEFLEELLAFLSKPRTHTDPTER